MINLQQEIKSIVQNQDFIVLPGIGAFLTEYSKPFFNSDGNIVPPKKKIEFNQLIDRDIDNKLFSMLSEKSNKSFDSIHTEYNQFLNKFRSEIVLNHKFHWEGLGTFYKNENQNLVFYVEEGLEIIQYSSIEKESEAAEVLTVDSNEIEYEEHVKSKSTSIFKILLYAIPLFLIISALAYTIFLKPVNEKSEKKNMVEEIDSLVSIPNERIVIPRDSIIDSITQKRRIVSTIKKQESPIINSTNQSKAKSHIVGIGMFKVKQNVDNLAARLAENGIPARVRRSGTNYKLFVTASSPEQAKEFIQKIEQLTGEKAVYENK